MTNQKQPTISTSVKCKHLAHRLNTTRFYGACRNNADFLNLILILRRFRTLRKRQVCLSCIVPVRVLQVSDIIVCVRLPLHPATPHWKTHSMAVRAIPLSVCHHGPPNGYRTGFKWCSDSQYLFNYQCRWHKCKSGWSLKTEKIHLKWHVYIDTTHTIRHLFPTWTTFTFLKT